MGTGVGPVISNGMLDLTREQLQKLVNESMAIPMPDPQIALLRDTMLEFTLRLHEIKTLATDAIERGSLVNPAQLITLLYGDKT
jgi:hypothetical protein